MNMVSSRKKKVFANAISIQIPLSVFYSKKFFGGVVGIILLVVLPVEEQGWFCLRWADVRRGP